MSFGVMHHARAPGTLAVLAKHESKFLQALRGAGLMAEDVKVAAVP